MKVLVCAAGTTGDVHPLVAIAERMRDRGHDVVLLANEAYAGLAAEIGVDFEPVGTASELDATSRHSDAWSYAGGWKIWIRDAGLGTMRRFYSAVERLNRPGETIVAASYLCFGARMARDKLNIPAATLHLNVHTIRTIYNVFAFPPPAFLRRILPHWYIRPFVYPETVRRMALWTADTFMIDAFLAGEINRFRRELGLPRLAAFVRDWWNSPDRIIGLYPEWWAGEHSDWPPQIVTTGFPFWDRSRSLEIPADLERFLQTGEGILIFTPGASDAHTDAHFAAFAAVCKNLNRRGLVLTPRQPDFAYDADRIRFKRFVPFQKLLPHAAAVVHHAGIGTSAQCLAAGLPQVVIPTLYNQPDTAIRLERMGVARQVSPRHFNVERLQHALNHVLTAPQVAASCRGFAERMKQNDSAIPETCRHLEELLTASATSRIAAKSASQSLQ